MVLFGLDSTSVALSIKTVLIIAIVV